MFWMQYITPQEMYIKLDLKSTMSLRLPLVTSGIAFLMHSF